MPCKMLYRKNTIVLNNRISLRKLNIASGLHQWSMFLKMMVKLVLVVIILSPLILASKYHNTLSHFPKMFFCKLSGGKLFTKLDLTNAYQQMPLDPESQEYVTINTHCGLYRYKRLPFGIASSPAIFQRTMEIILQGLEYVAVIQDDILISGLDDSHHF